MHRSGSKRLLEMALRLLGEELGRDMYLYFNYTKANRLCMSITHAQPVSFWDMAETLITDVSAFFMFIILFL